MQDESGVKGMYPVSMACFDAGLKHILGNPGLQYIKIGALCHSDQIKTLLLHLQRPRGYQIILDPVIKPTRGEAFLQSSDLPQLLELIGMADYVCPNLPELALLTGSHIESFEEAVSAAQKLSVQSGACVMVKGGHAVGDDIPEALVWRDTVDRFSFPRRAWNYAHGTGCAYATAFTCLLARGIVPREAFPQASDWVRSFFDEINAEHSSSNL